VLQPQQDAFNVRELIELTRKRPLKWYVPDIVLEDAVHVFHGAEESFKTMLTLQLHEALALGTKFLGRKVSGRYITGIAQLEMKQSQFGHRLVSFFQHSMPEIRVLPESLRGQILSAQTPRDRVGILADWAESEGLQFLSVDSVSKLFPAGYSPNEQDKASDVFNQIQRLPTSWILAHDRKPFKGLQVGNDEIVGSGRFKQDPDIVHQMVRKDARAPVAEFHWGKMRAGEKPEPLSLYFDRVDYRLYPFHPYLHLLEQKAMLGTDLVAEAEARYGWKERRARDYLETLKELIAVGGKQIVAQSFRGHAKVFCINKSVKFASLLTIPLDLVQGCVKEGGIYKGAILADAVKDTA
jgi:hypothetical protein